MMTSGRVSPHLSFTQGHWVLTSGTCPRVRVLVDHADRLDAEREDGLVVRVAHGDDPLGALVISVVPKACSTVTGNAPVAAAGALSLAFASGSSEPHPERRPTPRAAADRIAATRRQDFVPVVLWRSIPNSLALAPAARTPVPEAATPYPEEVRPA